MRDRWFKSSPRNQFNPAHGGVFYARSQSLSGLCNQELAGKFYIGLSENVQILAMQPIQRGRLPEKPTDRQAHAAEILQEVGQKTVS